MGELVEAPMPGWETVYRNETRRQALGPRAVCSPLGLRVPGVSASGPAPGPARVYPGRITPFSREFHAECGT
jgi:hypothetical protein